MSIITDKPWATYIAVDMRAYTTMVDNIPDAADRGAVLDAVCAYLVRDIPLDQRISADRGDLMYAARDIVARAEAHVVNYAEGLDRSSVDGSCRGRPDLAALRDQMRAEGQSWAAIRAAIDRVKVAERGGK